ncbi:hypothetical protein PC129_g10580 [Phytophthora cactorum]|uniref:BED-type domain-containing protein n=1 Tax=Phytophthora cactorum TaxID=29920 RepID=A0A8T1CZJ2_9STRA|nr:hypothetical protein PC111_g14071 [Phytophthora cactorum]KAG2819888.1 hypothetical protein PC112_g12011 [Phytophthora cactorum]KAG2855463.1 hypothetical protein PC113_g12422 [Phytophthora cactorum]KAG2901645.1 hypothetical protein PC114_g13099 [Phytophthora cactorum]KAG2917301.1 hypothetical protein PC115_g10758 [Phytophthora cactorum]
MSSSRAISSFFFTDCGGGQFSCKQCGKVGKQSPGTGYTNLISHLATSHPGFRETYDESQNTHGQSLEAHGFVDQRTMEVFKGMEWIIVRKPALSELCRHPGSSIRNFNVRIGSTQCFDISHDYDFHHFTNEVAKISAINGDLTPELVNGLLDYQTWSLTNRVLIADVSRLTEKDVPQVIQIQGVNAGCQGVNMLVLIVSEQELSYDRLTGEVFEFSTA